jgi:hypothetical protein
MRIIGNSLNGDYPANLVKLADSPDLQGIDLAVAYVTKMDELFELADRREVPVNLYALADGNFPNLNVAQRFVSGGRTSWRLFLTREFYHPKVMWFRGVGAYIGSANLTDKAWWRNLECGVWLDQDDLDDLNWVDELDSMLAGVRERCVEATKEHLDALRKLQDARRPLFLAEKKFAEQADILLSGIPGKDPPALAVRAKDRGGIAKQRFISEWESGLTLLRKISGFFEADRDRWPAWVDRDVHPSIVQDQATEWWYDIHHRRSGDSVKSIMEASDRNRSAPDAALSRLFDEWSALEDSPEGDWSFFINTAPRELQRLLSRESIRDLDAASLGRVIHLCHSARAHARQMKNHYFGLAAGEKRSSEVRSGLFAQFLLGRVSRAEKSVQDLLLYVIWGDQEGAEKNCSVRVWNAVQDPAWKLPHLGTQILGELIGYARPGDFPPRNNRVSKTLFALGHSDVRYSK